MDDTKLCWNQWNGEHSHPEQAKRQERAMDKKLTPLIINREDLSGSFKGSSGQYLTTLSTCTCTDFSRRKLPCKHMYRLAYELGIFQLSGNIGELPSAPLTKIETMEVIKNVLTPEEQQEFGYFCYCCGNTNNAEKLFSNSMSKKLLSSNLASEVTDVKKLLRCLHISQVRKFLPPGTKSPRTKEELITLVSPLITKDDIVFPDEKKCLTLHPCISHLGHAIHRQICAMYPDSESF